MQFPKHITFIGLNYYPEDSAIGLYSTQWVEYLEKQGAIINVITSFPYYPEWEIGENYKSKPRFLKEKEGNKTIYRYKQYTPKRPTFLKRIIHIIDFTVGSYFNIRKIKKCDLVISVVPFTSSAFLGNILRKRCKAKHWVHIQDFEFDAAFQSGVTKSKQNKKGFLYSMLMKLEKSILSKANSVSTISYAMLDKLKEKTSSKMYYLPNWIEGDKINPLQAKKHHYLTSKKFKILYSGNIGDKQDWEFFEKIVTNLDPQNFEFCIVGDGSKRAELQTSLKDKNNIKFYPLVPYNELSDLLCSADLHILFQKPEILDTVMPSKILGMLASGKPSIVTGHQESEVKKVMEDSNGGYYISKNVIKEVIDKIEALYANPDVSEKMGHKAREYVVKQFSKEVILDRFFQDIKKI